MKKQDPANSTAGQAAIGLGPAAQVQALADAAAKLRARRQRDALPHRIATRRLVLRAPIRGDVPDLVKLANNPHIAERLTRLPSPYTRADGVAFVEILAQRADERPYAITLDDHFLGVIGFSFGLGDLPEFGYWLGEPHWGKGIMSEAARALLDAAFATSRYPAIRARSLADNAASRRVLEKLGFHQVREELGTRGHLAGKPVVVLEVEQPRWT